MPDKDREEQVAVLNLLRVHRTRFSLVIAQTLRCPMARRESSRFLPLPRELALQLHRPEADLVSE